MVVDTLLQRPWDKFKAGGCNQSPMSCPGFGGMGPAFGEEKQVGMGHLADVPRWGMGCSNSSSLSYLNYIFSPHGIKLVLIISARGKRYKDIPQNLNDIGFLCIQVNVQVYAKTISTHVRASRFSMDRTRPVGRRL